MILGPAFVFDPDGRLLETCDSAGEAHSHAFREQLYDGYIQILEPNDNVVTELVVYSGDPTIHHMDFSQIV